VATLRAIRTRIKSVRSMQKITKAMKMVAASKLRRAQDAVMRARPYAQAIEEMLAEVLTERDDAGAPAHPLFAARPAKKAEVVMLTSDRGSAGAFNANITRRAQKFLGDEGSKLERVQFATIGRRGRDYAKKREFMVRADYPGLFGKLKFSMAAGIANDLIKQFEAGEIDQAFILYNEFKSAIAQKLTLVQLLPIVPPKAAHEVSPEEVLKKIQPAPHLFEPSREAVLGKLVPRHLSMQIWKALLESEASEHGARMTAMDSATKNAKEMIARLTLSYNRARQAAITKELMEIVSGAEALK
jgi:F-type H+-transporting ATPase subunit gamma